MNKSGLQYFSDGQQVEAEEQAAPEPTVYGQPATGGKPARYAIPMPKGGVPVPSTILEDMERIYQQKIESKNPFVEWMKDVSAWGGLGRPGTTQEALSRRRESKEAEAAELFRMRSDMAAVRAQQEQAKATNAYLEGQLGGGGGGGAGAVGPGAEIPQYVRDEIEFLRLRNPDEAKKKLDEYRKAFTTEKIKRVMGTDYDVKKNDRMIRDPQTGELKLHTLSNREIDELESQGVQLLPVQGSGATPVPTATPQAPAAIRGPAPAPTPSAAQEPKNFTYDELTPEDKRRMEQGMINMGLVNARDSVTREGADKVFNRASLEARKQIFKDLREGRPPIAPPETKAPAAPPATTPARAPAIGAGPTLSEMKAKIKAEETELTGMAGVDVKDYESFKDITKPDSTTSRASTSKEIIDLVTNNPNIVGVLQKPNLAAALTKIVEEGLSLPGGATIGVSAIDDAIAMAMPGTTKQDLEDRERLKTLFEATAFSLAAGLKGQGQITEFERRLLQQVSGSIKTTPQNIIKIHKMFLAKAEKDKMLGDLFAARPKNMPYSEFIRSKDYQRINEEYRQTVNALIKEKIVLQGKPEAGSSEYQTTKSGVKWKEVK